MGGRTSTRIVAVQRYKAYRDYGTTRCGSNAGRPTDQPGGVASCSSAQLPPGRPQRVVLCSLLSCLGTDLEELPEATKEIRQPALLPLWPVAALGRAGRLVLGPG